MAGSSDPRVLVDALPYIDTGFDDVAKAAAQALIDEECKRYRPSKDYLAFLGPLRLDDFVTDVQRKELDRIAAMKPMEQLNMKRYELPNPPVGKMTDLGAWQDAVNNSKAQLEHQRNRIENYNLLMDYGGESYKCYNETLARMVSVAIKEVNALKQDIAEINYERKSKQQNAGAKLKALEQSWVSLVSKNYQIEQACSDLEQELAPKRKKMKKS